MKVLVATTGPDARDLSTGLDGELVFVPDPLCEYGADCLCVDSGCRVFIGLITRLPTTVAMIAERDITAEDYTAQIAHHLRNTGYPAEDIDAAAVKLADRGLGHSERDVCTPGEKFYRVAGGLLGRLDQRVTVTAAQLTAANAFIDALGGDPVVALRAVARRAEMGIAYLGREDVAAIFGYNDATLTDDQWNVIVRDLDSVHDDLQPDTSDWARGWMDRLGLGTDC